MRATPHYRKRGRPSQGAQPAQIVYPIAGALASSIAARPPLVDQQSCFILATNARDETLLPVWWKKSADATLLKSLEFTTYSCGQSGKKITRSHNSSGSLTSAIR